MLRSRKQPADDVKQHYVETESVMTTFPSSLRDMNETMTSLLSTTTLAWVFIEAHVAYRGCGVIGTRVYRGVADTRLLVEVGSTANT